MSEGVSNESAQQVVNERLPSDQNYTERFVQALALDLLDSRARVKELEEALSEISFYSDDENARKRAERALRGEER